MHLDFTKIKDNWEYTFESTGAKNTVLPILFLASWLSVKFTKNIVLNNVPNLWDVDVCVKYLISLGVDISQEKTTIIIGKKSKLRNEIDFELYSGFRYSILTFWLLLSFFDSIKIPDKTGWCSLWERKNDLHYAFFESMWFEIKESENGIDVRKVSDIPKNIVFTPHVASTTVTENIILFCSLSFQNIKHIYIENFYGNRPDILEMLEVLKIFGYSFNFKNKILDEIYFTEKKVSDVVRYNILSDFDQALFYIVLAIVIKSDIKILNYFNTYPYKEIEFINTYFWDIIHIIDSTLCIYGKQTTINDKAIKIIADEYPHIMSDSQPILSILWLFSKSLNIVDNRFTNRYEYSKYYDLFSCKNKHASDFICIYWKNNTWVNTVSLDEEIFLYSIRESWLLLLLSIYFRASININNSRILERGYENIFNNLVTIWADVEKNK